MCIQCHSQTGVLLAFSRSCGARSLSQKALVVCHRAQSARLVKSSLLHQQRSRMTHRRSRLENYCGKPCQSGVELRPSGGVIDQSGQPGRDLHPLGDCKVKAFDYRRGQLHLLVDLVRF